MHSTDDRVLDTTIHPNADGSDRSHYKSDSVEAHPGTVDRTWLPDSTDVVSRYRLAGLPDGEASFPSWLAQRAEAHGDRIAITFLPDDYFSQQSDSVSLTYKDLWERSLQTARTIRGTIDGVDWNRIDQCIETPEACPRLLLLYPPGVEFLIGFLGAQLAGCIPVPTSFPRPHRELPRLNAAAEDCDPLAVLCDSSTKDTLALDKLPPQLKDAPIIATDYADEFSHSLSVPSPLAQEPNAIAFLQYTSGSTSNPKGVIVRQSNLMANLESIRSGFALDWMAEDATESNGKLRSGVFWLPFYHDMGLIGGILQPLYVGGRSVLISPRAFLQRPIRWLKAISDFRAFVSGAPNFAYQLCVDRIPPDQSDGLSLSHWQVAFCGAEPISLRTLQDFAHRFQGNGFSESAYYPCYGLAEATLLATGGKGPAKPNVLTLDRSEFQSGRIKALSNHQIQSVPKKDRLELVGCGSAVSGTHVAIVDADSRKRLPDGVIGEIWIRGKSVVSGYWKNESSDVIATDEDSFDGVLQGSDRGEAADKFFRTGDLGSSSRANFT